MKASVSTLWLVSLSCLSGLTGCSLDWGKDSKSGSQAMDDAGVTPGVVGDGGGIDAQVDEPTQCVPPACDPCEAKPCLNEGICATTDTSFECTCKVGFSGKKCEADVCELDPCDHGECTRRASGRSCKCEPGWEGDACDTNTNAALASLTVSAGTLYPAFKPNVFDYSVDLGISAPEIALTPTVAVPDGVVLKLDGLAATSGQPSALYAMELNTSKVVPIEVTADDGTKLTYEITVRRSLVQQAYVKRSSSTANDGFGDMALAADGDTAAVGIRSQSRVQLLTRTFGAWALASTEVQLPQTYTPYGFGAAVALTPGWLIVGAHADTFTTGAAYAIRRSTIASGQLDVHTLGTEQPQDDRKFGTALAARGDTIVVGAPGENVIRDGVVRENAGAVYVFEFDGSSWGIGQRLTSPTASTNEQFGTTVALDGSLLAVGAPCDDQGAADPGNCAGAVHVFERRGAWQPAGVLRIEGSVLLGIRVGVAAGRIAVASGRYCFLSCAGQPDAYVFSRSGDDWVAAPVRGLPRVEDTPSVLDPEGFGLGGMVFDGASLVISAPGEDLMAQGLNPPRNSAGERAADAGAVYVFVERSDGWQLDAYVKASNAEAGDRFGQGVAGADGTWFIAAPREDSDADSTNGDQANNDAEDSGAVYVFSTNCANVPAGASVPGC